MQQQMTTGFAQLNARFDYVDTRMDALANTHVQIQHRLTRLSTDFCESRHPNVYLSTAKHKEDKQVTGNSSKGIAVDRCKLPVDRVNQFQKL
ncbi:hypothetical protein Taro_027831 [Colocasia esculenta]|uniref:Uncharacterized protein n=1 Tax=Colocasia esculenta TaxID=4460 RepID=A0A843VVG1_COLES|nr:hypothetical protein [Colocasia esculenta]